MAQQQQTPPVGADVTALMGGQTTVPPVGADVSALMGAAPPPPAAPPKPTGLQHPHAVVGDAVVGGAKALGRTAMGLIELINAMSPIKADLSSIDAALAPTSTAQKVGGTVADIGTAIVPAGRVSNIARNVSRMIPGRVGPALARGVVEGGAGAGIAALQGNDPLAAGVVSGVAGAAIPALASKLKQGADESMVAALGPAGRGTGPSGAKDLAAAKAAAPRLLKENFQPRSHAGALELAEAKVQSADMAIDAVMSNLAPGTTVRTATIQQALQDAIRAETIVGSAGKPVVTGASKVKVAVYEQVLKELKQLGSRLTPEQAVALRQKYGPLAKWNNVGSNSDQLTAEAYRTVYNGVRQSIENLDPAIHGANQDMHFWLGVQDLLEKATRRPQAPSSGTTGALMAAAGMVASGGTSGMVLAAGIGGRQLQRLMRSPGWRFVSANAKDDIAQALTSGNEAALTAAVANATAQMTAGAK